MDSESERQSDRDKKGERGGFICRARCIDMDIKRERGIKIFRYIQINGGRERDVNIEVFREICGDRVIKIKREREGDIYVELDGDRVRLIQRCVFRYMYKE